MRIQNLGEVIEECRRYLPDYLERHGRNLKKQFQCPNEWEHSNGDKHPSCGFVDKERTTWNCFACGESGDIFTAAKYLENAELSGSGFIDTVTTIAEMFGIRIDQDDDAADIVRALTYTASIVKKGVVCNVAADYLANRELTEISDEFGIGYANPDKLRELLLKSYDNDFIQRNSLAAPQMFKDRLVFPLHDSTGDVVGFAGRALTDKNPKYINSAGSIVYQKSKFLYNLHRISGSKVYVVEGYADVWRMHMYGFPAVATAGTAITEDHIRMLARQRIKNIVFCFDSDDAGQKALTKAIELCTDFTNINISYVQVPKESKDPDAFIREFGPEAFIELAHTEVLDPKKKLKARFTDRIDNWKEKTELSEMPGYRTTWSNYDLKMEFVQPGLHLVGGISNIGKTAWMTQLALHMAKNNPNLFVLYASIDDSFDLAMSRILANLGEIPVNQARNPNFFIEKTGGMSQKEREIQWRKRDNGIAKLKSLSKNFEIIDITDASRLEELEVQIKRLREVHGKDVALFLDNFHKVRTKAFNNPRERFTYVSEEIKRITTENEMVTFSTVELTKLGHKGRPEVENIKETVDIIYDASTIHMLHQDYHSKQGDTDFKFTTGEFPGQELPILEVAIAKNKISGWKGRLYYKFYPDHMKFTECSGEEHNRFRAIEVKTS